MKTPQFFRYLAPLIAAAFLISFSDMRAETGLPAVELQKKIRLVIEKSGPAVVGLTPDKSGGAGSGVIVSEDGLILTAAHVINAGSGDEMTVWLTDGRQAKAKKLGSQTGRDAAMLQIVGGGKWPFIDVRKGNPERGEWVVAMGHPGGFQPERTPPVRLGRVLQSPSADGGRGNFLVSDCTVSGGDSGGPLFDLDGRVVGIHSSIGQSLEENRHVPITAYTADWDRLVKGESWGGRMFAGGRPREGAVMGVQLAPSAGGEGAVVEAVVDDSPAAKAGIRGGDIIIGFAGKVIGDAAQLIEAVGAKKPGDKVKVSLRRGENEKEVELELGDAAKLSSSDLEEFRAVQQEATQRPSFGVRIADVEDGKGAEVIEVLPGSVAAKSGVREGDVIVGFAGKAVENAESLVAAVRGFGGTKAPVRLRRADKGVRLEANFPKAKAEAPKAKAPKPEPPKAAAPKERGEGGFRAKGFFFDGEKMREVDPEKLREMLKKGGIPDLDKFPEFEKPELGVEIEDGDEAIVSAVIAGSLAEKAGIKKGDKIIELAGQKVTDFDSLVAAVGAMSRRWETDAKVRRGDKTLDLHIEVAAARIRPGVRRFGFQMKDGKVVPMTPEEFEKLVPNLRVDPAPEKQPAPGAGAGKRALLGVMADPRAEGDGVLVAQVAKESAAEKAGIKAGDRIHEIDGNKVDSYDDLAGAILAKEPGDKVKIRLERDGKKKELEAKLGSFPATESAEAPEQGGLSPERLREMERMRRGEIKPEDFERMFGQNPGRGSRVDPNLKRANGEILKGFEPAVSKAKGSTVTVRDGDKRIAMGTVVSGGRVLTKASQVKGKKQLLVQRPDGKVTGAKQVRTFEKFDLAVLELEDARGLKPVRFADSSRSGTVGTLVTSPNQSGDPAGFGVVSVAARSLSEENKGFLGIQIGEADERGVSIAQAFDGGAAQKAGLRTGDVIVKAAGVKVTSPTALIRQVAGRKPGEEVVINYIRGEKADEVKVKLRSRADMGDNPERMSQTARMGTRLSDQRSGYPSALTHDMPVNPEECGSPLINLEGEIVGINIARAGRTKTYALPGEIVSGLLSEPAPAPTPTIREEGKE